MEAIEPLANLSASNTIFKSGVKIRSSHYSPCSVACVRSLTDLPSVYLALCPVETKFFLHLEEDILS